MIKNWLSRYSLRYPQSLVYMLQACEYSVRDYVSWFNAVKNFNHIQRRKKFVKTTKGLLLLGIAWGIVFFLLGVVIFILLIEMSPRSVVAFVIIIILAPFFLAYGIIIPLLISKIIIQWPLEYFIVKSAQKKLRAHTGVKIGIAGSFGKTTMREILKTVLSEGKHVAASPHNYNTPLGISQFVQTLKGDEDILIFEFGEYYPGDVRKLCNLVRPTIGVITGVNEAHFEKFRSLNRTAKTIFELADYLGDRPVYVNGENEIARNNVRPGHIIYDREHCKGLNIENPKTDLTGTSFILIKNDIRMDLHSDLLGLHQIGPLAVAATIALESGLSPKQIIIGIQNTKPFDHRMEQKIDAEGVILLDDSYNGNPDGVKAVIDFLDSLKHHRRFYITPGLVEMGLRTEEVHKQIGRWLAKANIERVILIKNSVTAYIETGLNEQGYSGEIAWFDDALAALAALPHLTVKGDVVLLQNDWPDQYQ